MKQFKKVAVGGTFDELHKGHKALLSKAFEIGDRVVIGLTSDGLVSEMQKPHLTASYEERLKGLEVYLSERGLWNRTEVVTLLDSHGSSVRDPKIEALVVSEETKPTADKINERRRKVGLPLLTIATVSMVPSQNCSPISTTRIRRGEMDREGRLLKVAGRA